MKSALNMVLTLALSLSMGATVGCAQGKELTVTDGTVELSAIQLQSGNHQLRGQWKYYPGELRAPDLIRSSSAKAERVMIPSSDPLPRGPKEYVATYAVELKSTGEAPSMLALRIRTCRASQTLFVSRGGAFEQVTAMSNRHKLVNAQSEDIGYLVYLISPAHEGSTHLVLHLESLDLSQPKLAQAPTLETMHSLRKRILSNATIPLVTAGAFLLLLGLHLRQAWQSHGPVPHLIFALLTAHLTALSISSPVLSAGHLMLDSGQGTGMGWQIPYIVSAMLPWTLVATLSQLMPHLFHRVAVVSIGMACLGVSLFISLSEPTDLLVASPLLIILAISSGLGITTVLMRSAWAKDNDGRALAIGATIVLAALLYDLLSPDLSGLKAALSPVGLLVWCTIIHQLLSRIELSTTSVANELESTLRLKVAEATANFAEADRKRKLAIAASERAKESEYEALDVGFAAEVAREQIEGVAHKQELFLQNMSHELRTPLTLILNPLLNAAAEYPDNHDIELALQNSQRLLRLVNQLLDFQLLNSGERGIDLRPVDLVSFVQTCSEYFVYSCGPKNISFKATVEGQLLGDYQSESHDCPIFILSEVDALEKVIFNLLSNALKFTPENGEIELSVERIEGSILLNVKDTGPGIEENHLASIFDSFSQIDDSETRSYEGAGLGLAYAKSLTEVMHGQIGVQSIPGLGSRFWISFPICEEPETAATNPFKVKDWLLADGGYHTTAPPAEAGPSSSHKSSPGTILVVDDLPEMRALIRHAVSRQGYQVIEAVNGREALETARRTKPDLVITDWMMPIMTGPELVNHMKTTARLSAIPIILLTAKSDQASKQAAIQAGADGFLAKPFEQTELVSLVRNLLKLRSAERAAADIKRKNALSQVAAELAHELNNPLNFINGGVHQLKSIHSGLKDVLTKLFQNAGPDSHQIRDFFQKEFAKLQSTLDLIDKGVDRSGTVVADLRNLTGVDGSTYEIINIRETLDAEYQTLAEMAGGRYHAIKIGQLASIGAEFTGNPVVFRRVIRTCLECCCEWALDHDSSPEIFIEFKLDHESGMVVTLSQNGQLFDPDLANTIFHPADDGHTNIGWQGRLIHIKSLWQDHGGELFAIKAGLQSQRLGLHITIPSNPIEPTVASKRQTSESDENSDPSSREPK